jgi:hypothetical protein
MLLLRFFSSEAVNDVGVLLADFLPALSLSLPESVDVFGRSSKLEGRLKVPADPAVTTADPPDVCAEAAGKLAAFPPRVRPVSSVPSAPFSSEASTDCQLDLKFGAVAADETDRLPEKAPAHPAF